VIGWLPGRPVATAEAERHPTGAHGQGSLATRRRYLIFGVASTALFMSSIDQTIVATAFGTLQQDLHAAVNWSSWTITIYALGLLLMMPIAGALSDIYGRKRVFLIAIAVFTVSSLACGLSTNIYELVILRGLQALGGGAFMPSAIGVVADDFGTDRDRAIGMFSSIVPIGAIVGPILGGVLITYWSWRGIFLVNIPTGIALFALVAVVVPSSARQSQRTLDGAGVLILGLGLLGIMLGISYLGAGDSSATSPVFLISLLTGIALIGAFIWHSSRSRDPIVPIRILRTRSFALMNLVHFCHGAAFLGFASLVPLYAEERFHLSVLSAGTLLTARGIGMISVAALAVFSLRRTGYRLPMAVGFLLTSLGTVLLAVPPGGIRPYIWLAIAGGITGVGSGMAFPAANNATLQLAPESAASISGLRGMFRQAGGITGLAIATSIMARNSNPGRVEAMMFVALGIVLVLMVPIIYLVPDHRGSW
jgi:EmrB/QacA subfamily drug resistance transporter